MAINSQTDNSQSTGLFHILKIKFRKFFNIYFQLNAAHKNLYKKCTCFWAFIYLLGVYNIILSVCA